jgi:LacI family transcriptional regulator
MARKRVTQADVAQRAGVSQTAVSQILGNLQQDSSFRPETRAKVLKAAEELGYIPNVAARALRTNRTMTIGIALSYLTDELALRITHGIQEIAHERGYGVFIAETEQDALRERQVLDQFRHREVDGLIFVDSWTNPEVYLNDDQNPPMMFAQLRESLADHNCVGMDNFRGGYEATSYLFDLGYRKVAHISGPEHWTSSCERSKGYRKVIENHHLSYDPSLLEYADWEISSGLDATHVLLDRHPDIEAIFVANDLMAAGSIQAAASRGLRIPQDLALVGYDDRYLTQATLPPLTSYAIPVNQIGQKAAHLLINHLLRKNAREVPSISLSGKLIVRASCRALASQPGARYISP